VERRSGPIMGSQRGPAKGATPRGTRIEIATPRDDRECEVVL
jgi:hypothetical protein